MTVEAIWKHLSEDLRRFIRRRVPDDATADDVLQDVFVRIHERLEQLADDERVTAWVYRIARNRIADYYRSSSRPPPAWPEEPEEPAFHPDEEMQARENQRVGGWLADMIDALPATYREAVRMVEIEGATQAEVASRLGLSVSGAKSRVQRGRAELRRILGRCCHVEMDRRGNVLEITRRRGCC